MRLPSHANANERKLGASGLVVDRFVLEETPHAARASANAHGMLEGVPHRHYEAQLLTIFRGELVCEASGAWSLVPPGSALWVPSQVEHRIRAAAPLEGYNVFLDPSTVKALPTMCCTVTTTPLSRAIIQRLALSGAPPGAEGPAAHLAAVLLDELADVAIDDLRLPMPRDPRLRKLVDLLTASPGEGAKMATWARRVGVAERTLNRLLVAETGMSFGRWRKQLHLVLAIRRLARGASVQNVASELGYESASSFVTMFRKAMGTSPARYMAERMR